MVVTILFLCAACASDTSQPTVVASTVASTDTNAPSTGAPDDGALSLVAIGDSIPYNSADDCPGCTGFVDRYAQALTEATGKEITVHNESMHTGLTLEGLLDQLDDFAEELSTADIIIVGIAHNSSELAQYQPCDAPLRASGYPNWDLVEDPEGCAVASAEEYRPQYESLFTQVAKMREGSPTILRALNRYSDWIGWEEAELTPADEEKTKVILDAWSAMICDEATASGFECADIYHAFNGDDGLSPAGDLLAGDYTHPSDRGNEVIAEVLIDLGFDPLG